MDMGRGSMGCARCREALSARLDEEVEPVPAEWTDRHLAGCAACRTWQRQIVASTRRLRVRPVAVPQPDDLVARTLARAWPPRPATSGRRWRIALAVVAAAQVALAVAQTAGWDAGMRSSMPGDMSAHLFDESTAWNLALGVGMAWVAWRTRAVAGVLPVFGGFLLVLAGFCVHDLAAGEVTVTRVAEHGLLLVGVVMMVMVRRTAGGPAGPPSAAGRFGGVPGPPRSDPDEPEAAGQDERRPGGFRLRPVDHRRAA